MIVLIAKGAELFQESTMDGKRKKLRKVQQYSLLFIGLRNNFLFFVDNMKLLVFLLENSGRFIFINNAFVVAEIVFRKVLVNI